MLFKKSAGVCDEDQVDDEIVKLIDNLYQNDDVSEKIKTSIKKRRELRFSESLEKDKAMKERK